MSFNTDWDIDKYKDEHESEDHWELRRRFMERWKEDYCEDRLVCLARVFANVELLGCRYPVEVMQEIAQLSHDVAKQYRDSRKDKLKRTFVSASDAAEDRARGIKREGGVIVEGPEKKSAKINFVRPSESTETTSNDINKNYNEIQDIHHNNNSKITEINSAELEKPQLVPETTAYRGGGSETNEYFKEMEKLRCLDIRTFNERMFHTDFGRMVLLIRPWSSKIGNIQSSCQVCHLLLSNMFVNGVYTLKLNGQLLANAFGPSKSEAKSVAENLAWNRLLGMCVSVVMKEQFIAQGDSRISMSDVTGREEFGTPIENSVATKMMKLMGWKGGGLGADAQGIAEPIKPHLQMVNRAGLGSQSTDIRQLRNAAQTLMQRFIASDSLDIDLVFSSEFSKEERAALHQVAQRAGLSSKSYGDKDRFLVVKKKLDPFSLVRAVVEKGGSTPKYQVFIPATLAKNH